MKNCIGKNIWLINFGLVVEQILYSNLQTLSKAKEIRVDEENIADGFGMNFCKTLVKKSTLNDDKYEQYEEPLIDVIDEGDNIKLLVQGRCLEHKVSIHVNRNRDGITICREQCNKKKEIEIATCNDVCSKNIPLNLKELQLENMLFVVSKCYNNNVLEISIPKTGQMRLK